MRRLLLFLLIVFPLMLSAQKEIKLKRKYFGKYKGMVAGYQMNSGIELIDIGETPIVVLIDKEQIYITIGDRKLVGTYTVMFKAQKYYLLDAEIDGQLANERILVYFRGKRISRDGMYPQPVTELKKTKK
ncbi:MAG: hypothetical protein MK066_05645 [Crocinitomicaceae bacterium]|nr:hypothetical protein [Crocinitomicaceae bacterium]